jgi:hypothetical protein
MRLALGLAREAGAAVVYAAARAARRDWRVLTSNHALSRSAPVGADGHLVDHQPHATARRDVCEISETRPRRW